MDVKFKGHHIMAGLVKRGAFFSVRFVNPDGHRKIVALRTKSPDRAELACRRIGKLVAALQTGSDLDEELTRWVAKLPDKLRSKMEAAGLLEVREEPNAVALGDFLDAYVSRRGDVKDPTKINWGHTIRNLKTFFGSDRQVADISKADAKDFLVYLKTKAGRTGSDGKYKPLAGDTIRKRTSNAKQFFGDAVDRGMIPTNPFHGMESSTKGNRERDFFVTPEMAYKVLDACPDREWRLLFALSRFGGLRCPSEHCKLKLDDVDWSQDRMEVHSPKTEHHDGKTYRWVPLFPELKPFLEECWEAAQPGQKYFVTRLRDPKQNRRTQLQKIIRRAGLEPWPKLFQNLRSTRQTELEEVFPSHVVCAWIGNSQKVAAKHYLQVTDDHFEKASRARCATSKAPQTVANEISENEKDAQSSRFSHDAATAVGDAGFEPVTSAV